MSRSAKLFGYLASGVLAFSVVASAGADTTSKATVTVPMVVEDNSAVLARQLLNPVQLVRNHRPLKMDNASLPVLRYGWVNDLDTHEDRDEVGAQGLGAGWDSIGSGSVWPPDTCGATGPTNVLVATNAGFRIYNKTGTQQFSSSFSSFFSGVMPGSSFTSDPRVVYDQYSGRWFLMILAIHNSTYYSYYLVAVSDDSDPNGTWTKWAIDSTLNGSTATGNWSDYPGLGFDSNAIYITANMFSRTTFSFQHVKMRIVPKAQMLSGSPTLTWFDIASITNADGSTASTCQPVSHYGTYPAPFFVNVQSTKLNIFGINNPITAPTLTKKNATITSITNTVNAAQSGGSPTLDTIDTRPYNGVYRNNYVYFGHTATVSSVSVSKWYQVNVTSWPTSITLKTSGSVTSSGKHMWFPSVAVNKYDILFIGTCYSSSADFAGAYYSYRYDTDAAGTTATPSVIIAGQQHYTGEGGSPVRWGDYSGAVVDPADDETFWHFNEYAKTGTASVWTTRAQAVTVPAPGGAVATTLVESGLAGAFGQTVAQTATLTKTSDGTPVSGKTITFTVNGSSSGSGATNGSGVATANYTIPESLGVGTFPLTANWAGDGSYTASSGGANIVVSKANTAQTTANQSGAYGQGLTLTTTLTRTTDNGGLNAKLITFKVDGSSVGTANTNASGVANLSYTVPTSLGTGAHTLTAEFAGDTLYNSSTGSGTLTVNKASTAISGFNKSGTYGQTVTLEGILSRTTDGAALSGKTLTFLIDGSSVGTANTNASGYASVNYLITEAKAVGAHTITVDFAGDTQYIASSAGNTLTINKGNTSTAAANASGPQGTNVSLTATLTRTQDGAGVNGRTVAFSVDGGFVGNGTTNMAGVASFSYAIPGGMSVGGHSITAAFAGDSQYNASSDATKILTVTAGTATVNGNVDLQFIFDPTGQTSTIEFRTPSTLTVIYSAGITLDGAGNYSVSGVPPGTYDVAVKFTSWLRQVLPSVAVSGTTTGVDFSLICGDAFEDNQVDLFDMNTVMSDFGAGAGDPGDINWDGTVDLFDLNIVFGDFGMVGDN